MDYSRADSQTQENSEFSLARSLIPIQTANAESVAEVPSSTRIADPFMIIPKAQEMIPESGVGAVLFGLFGDTEDLVDRRDAFQNLADAVVVKC